MGVFVRRGKGGPLTVVEYSELDQSLASAINQQTGRLRYCWSNVNFVLARVYNIEILESLCSVNDFVFHQDIVSLT